MRGLVGTGGRKAQTAVATTKRRSRRKGRARIPGGAVSAGTKEVDR